MANWTFITNYGAVLAYLDRHPRITARELALAIGITERAVRKIIADLEAGEYISKRKQGRRIIYSIDRHRSLRHKAFSDVSLRDFLDTLWGKKKKKKAVKKQLLSA